MKIGLLFWKPTLRPSKMMGLEDNNFRGVLLLVSGMVIPKWFQSIQKICVKMGIFPNFRGETKIVFWGGGVNQFNVFFISEWLWNDGSKISIEKTPFCPFHRSFVPSVRSRGLYLQVPHPGRPFVAVVLECYFFLRCFPDAQKVSIVYLTIRLFPINCSSFVGTRIQNRIHGVYHLFSVFFNGLVL